MLVDAIICLIFLTQNSHYRLQPQVTKCNWISKNVKKKSFIFTKCCSIEQSKKEGTLLLKHTFIRFRMFDTTAGPRVALLFSTTHRHETSFVSELYFKPCFKVRECCSSNTQACAQPLLRTTASVSTTINIATINTHSSNVFHFKTTVHSIQKCQINAYLQNASPYK